MIWLLALNFIFTFCMVAIMATSTEERFRKEYMRGYADGADTIINGEYTSLEVEIEKD